LSLCEVPPLAGLGKSLNHKVRLIWTFYFSRMDPFGLYYIYEPVTGFSCHHLAFSTLFSPPLKLRVEVFTRRVRSSSPDTCSPSRQGGTEQKTFLFLYYIFRKVFVKRKFRLFSSPFCLTRGKSQDASCKNDSQLMKRIKPIIIRLICLISCELKSLSSAIGSAEDAYVRDGSIGIG